MEKQDMQKPVTYTRRVRRQVTAMTIVFITVIHISYCYLRGKPIIDTASIWLIAVIGATILIHFSFCKVEKLREKLDRQLFETQQQYQRQSALAYLSGVFANTLDEDEICMELANRLREVQGYEQVSVYLLNRSTGERVLRADTGHPITPATLSMPPGIGISERPILDGQLHYTPDVSKENQYLPGLGHGSEIDISIKYGTEVMGVLIIESYQIDAFKQDDFDLLTAAADQAAIALENAQLYYAAKISAEKLLVLHEASQDIVGAGMDIESVYTAIHEAAKRLMPCDAFVISILDDASQEIEVAYLVDRDGRTPPQRMPSGQGLSGHIISTGKAMFEYDFPESDKAKSIKVAHFGSPEQVRAFIAVPLRLGDRIIGMLSTQSYQPHEYTPDNQYLLEMLAAHAAIAIDNAKLFAEIQRMAIMDSLTEVYNRRYLFETACREFSRSQRYQHPLSIIMLDLDHYKRVNDTYGHATGDHVLKLVAARIQEHTRESDTLGRYGGDEFCILLPETDLPGALEIAERLRVHVAGKPISNGQEVLTITISLGVSSTAENITDLSQLMLCTDTAMYDAKQAGRNCVCSRNWPLARKN